MFNAVSAYIFTLMPTTSIWKGAWWVSRRGQGYLRDVAARQRHRQLHQDRPTPAGSDRGRAKPTAGAPSAGWPVRRDDNQNASRRRRRDEPRRHPVHGRRSAAVISSPRGRRAPTKPDPRRGRTPTNSGRDGAGRGRAHGCVSRGHAPDLTSASGNITLRVRGCFVKHHAGFDPTENAIMVPHSIASSSAIMPSIMPRPICQKAGSVASRPKGFSSSAWCLVPPAESIARYRSANPSWAFSNTP